MQYWSQKGESWVHTVEGILQGRKWRRVNIYQTYLSSYSPRISLFHSHQRGRLRLIEHECMWSLSLLLHLIIYTYTYIYIFFSWIYHFKLSKWKVRWASFEKAEEMYGSVLHACNWNIDSRKWILLLHHMLTLLHEEKAPLFETCWSLVSTVYPCWGHF